MPIVIRTAVKFWLWLTNIVSFLNIHFPFPNSGPFENRLVNKNDGMVEDLKSGDQRKSEPKTHLSTDVADEAVEIIRRRHGDFGLTELRVQFEREVDKSGTIPCARASSGVDDGHVVAHQCAQFWTCVRQAALQMSTFLRNFRELKNLLQSLHWMQPYAYVST